VVERRRAAARSVRRRVNLLRGLGVMFVVGALAVTAAAHTFVASDQQRIDALETQLSQALAAQQNLQLSRAELESPSRVLAIAERRLGMVSPAAVTYLAPAQPGPSVAQVQAARSRAALVAAAAKAVEVRSAQPARTGSPPAKTRTSTSLAGPGSSAVTAPTG
jgi:cell division protein FtsL